jgi:hypothetical protein
MHKYKLGDFYKEGSSIYMTGKDCYALRCALLHEGHQDLREQKPSEKLQKINFIVPNYKTNRHKINFSNIEYQLEVDKFCLDICSGAKQWLSDVSTTDEIQGRSKKLLEI